LADVITPQQHGFAPVVWGLMQVIEKLMKYKQEYKAIMRLISLRKAKLVMHIVKLNSSLF
jgi:transposase